MPTNSSKILKIFSAQDIKYGITLFTDSEKKHIEQLIEEREGKFFIKCQIKERVRPAKPEEIVRQLWIHRLLKEYNYPKKELMLRR